MIDRASTFADEEMVALLKRGVPVAIDQAYERRQQDNKGDFWRRIVEQSPRKGTKGTTQGFYVVTPKGELLLFNNNRDPEKVRRLVGEAFASYDAQPAEQRRAQGIDDGVLDARYSPVPPEGGLVVRVRSKVLGGYEETAGDKWWRRLQQQAISRDNLWITQKEHAALADGELPEAMVHRLARYHLVDATRGEPPMWKPKEVRKLDVKREGNRIRGFVELATDDGKRGFEAELYGVVHAADGKVTRFDLVASGEFWGEGRYTRGAPKGRFPLVVGFELADGEQAADKIPPQGSRGWVEGYFRDRR